MIKAFYSIAIAAVSFLAGECYSQSKTDTIAHNLGKNINSKADDVGACLSPNGLTIYFVSNRFSNRPHIYSAKRKSLNSPWEESDYVKITNNPQDNFTAIALDGIGRFYVVTSRESKDKGDMNIWEGFGLDSVITMHPLPAPVNTINWENQPSVTRDGSDIYFATDIETPHSSKLGTLINIYAAHRKSDGSWTTPQNLGPEINIGNYNGSPFISPDGRFLFFSSKEKKALDVRRKIYISERIGPKNTDWSKAILLPAPINSDKDDMYPFIESDGKTILFSSNRGAEGFDIYEATLPEDIQNKIASSFPGYMHPR